MTLGDSAEALKEGLEGSLGGKTGFFPGFFRGLDFSAPELQFIAKHPEIFPDADVINASKLSAQNEAFANLMGHTLDQRAIDKMLEIGVLTGLKFCAAAPVLASLGDQFEERVKNTFRNKIIRQNEILMDAGGRVIGEIDFETAEAIIEVGISLNKKTEQLHKLAEITVQRSKRHDIIYGPRTSPGTLKFLKESLEKNGVTGYDSFLTSNLCRHGNMHFCFHHLRKSFDLREPSVTLIVMDSSSIERFDCAYR
jgi:hypothetical protein